MNKEYLYLSDKVMLVIDSNGHAVKRDIENNNMHDILLLENDLEKINETITKLEKIINREEENKLTKKDKIILAMTPFIIGIMSLGVACLFSPSVYSIAIPATIGIALGTVTLDIAVYRLINNQYIKQINGTKSELSTAYQLKENLEQQLSKLKEKTEETKINNQMHDVLVLEEPTLFYREARKQLYESYMTGYEQKVKRLTLKKQK